MPVVPPVRPASPTLPRWPIAAAAAGGAAVTQSEHTLEPELLALIDQALKECADEARSHVMLQQFKTRGPTREECEEVLYRDSQGQPVTRAMQLGVEQHKVALECAERKLGELKPGGFSISPRYRYDSQTGMAEHIPSEVVKQLLKAGRGAELRGTIEPDIVIHDGSPSRVQAVYDYKFPCTNTDRRSRWREYPDGAPRRKSNQKNLYWDALKVEPALVQPHLGVLR